MKWTLLGGGAAMATGVIVSQIFLRLGDAPFGSGMAAGVVSMMVYYSISFKLIPR